MGQIAGIGDSLVVGLVIPILLGIAMGMSGDGSLPGAILQMHLMDKKLHQMHFFQETDNFTYVLTEYAASVHS